jgi:type II secretory pathway component PulF
MSENLKTDSKRLQTIAWTCTFLACLFLEGMYFGAGFVIDTFANMFSGMGVEPPPVARFVFNNRYLLPVLFVGAGVLVLVKELFIRDKKRSLATTLLVTLLVMFAFGFFCLTLYLPVRGLN